jgi:hypothetical protein
VPLAATRRELPRSTARQAPTPKFVESVSISFVSSKFQLWTISNFSTVNPVAIARFSADDNGFLSEPDRRFVNGRG